LAGQGALFSFGPQKLLTCFGGGMLVIDPSLAEGCPSAPHPPVPLGVRVSTYGKVLVALGMTPALYRWTLYPVTWLALRLADFGFVWLRDLAAPPRMAAAYRFEITTRPGFRRFMPRLCARQLDRLADNVARRRAAVAAIKRATGEPPGIQFLDEDRFGTANAAYFGLYVPDPEAFAEFMLKRGVEVEPHQFYDCGGLPQFAPYAADCPNARYASEHLVRLPSYPDLSKADISRISRAIRAYSHALFAAPKTGALAA
jgi:hypothetical protein